MKTRVGGVGIDRRGCLAPLRIFEVKTSTAYSVN